MSQLCYVQIHINGQETFFLNEKIVCTYSEKLRKIVRQERRRAQKRNNLVVEIDDFPGGPEGFELVSRFFHSHNSGGTTVTVTAINAAVLYCSAAFLGVSQKLSASLVDAIFRWSWRDTLVCLASCDGALFPHADSCGLLEKLVFALSAKIAQSSDAASLLAAVPSSSSSSSSSPEPAATPESVKPSSSSKAWWFDDLATLPPKIIERLAQSLSLNNNGLTVTKFLLHYLKLAIPRRGRSSKREFSALAETAVHGVISARNSFSCRSLFWVLRVVSSFGVERETRLGLERLIGEALGESKLDDLLVCGNNGGVYDVSLVIRLVRVFVVSNNNGGSDEKLKKVGRLIDKYLAEISPDHNLKVSKFLMVAESVTDSARVSFDGVYRAIDIYLESHPTLSSEERAKLCRCLNYKKLSLEACKELAKNPKIPPRIAMQALISQQSKLPTKDYYEVGDHKMAKFSDERFVKQNEDVKLNLQTMQRRVVELEKVCREMKGQMSRMVRQNVLATPTHSKTLPRLC